MDSNTEFGAPRRKPMGANVSMAFHRFQSALELACGRSRVCWLVCQSGAEGKVNEVEPRKELLAAAYVRLFNLIVVVYAHEAVRTKNEPLAVSLATLTSECCKQGL